MESVQLLTLGLAITLFLAVYWRRGIRRGRRDAAKKPPLIEISDSAAARTVLIDHADAFSNRPLTLFPVALVTGQRRRRSDSISSAQYGPLWRALRCNLTSEALHPSRFDQLGPLQREFVASLVASLTARIAAGDSGGGVVVVRDDVHAAVFGVVARLCFGELVVGNARHVLAMRRVMQGFVRAIGEANVFAGSWLAKLVHWRRWRRFLGYRGQQAAFFLPLVSERERRRRSGCCNDGGIRPYVDTLIDLRVPDDDGDNDGDDDTGKMHVDARRRTLTDDELVSLLSEFLGASTESAVSCIEWALAHLATKPEVQKKLRREITGGGGDHGEGGAVSEERLRGLPYLHAVVLESLRLHPPVPFLMRDVVHAEGVATVPAGGARVHFLIRDMATDGKDWTDPDEFRPERFLAGGEAEGVGAVPGPKEIRMMPFGAGRRYCPGAGMGMMHVKCFLAALVREFEWAPAADRGGVVDFTELDGFFKVMKTPLRAVPTHRVYG
ncbi:unnamed protein product [Urochloa decumbens]|uniref:Uncharacterized protein n=1 Tax=Urochloa decumbens TaxID=240449 RepID=A0ABC9D0C4_9POAL